MHKVLRRYLQKRRNAKRMDSSIRRVIVLRTTFQNQGLIRLGVGIRISQRDFVPSWNLWLTITCYSRRKGNLPAEFIDHELQFFAKILVNDEYSACWWISEDVWDIISKKDFKISWLYSLRFKPPLTYGFARRLEISLRRSPAWRFQKGISYPIKLILDSFVTLNIRERQAHNITKALANSGIWYSRDFLEVELAKFNFKHCNFAEFTRCIILVD